MRRSIMATVMLGATLCVIPVVAVCQSAAPATDWPVYGRDPGGSRFSPLTRITKDNVSRLEIAWVFNTGEAGVTVTRGAPPALEATPVVIDGTMYFPTPLGRVIALDAATGRERWRHDPGVDPTRGYGDFASRGVAYWHDSSSAAAAVCARRILFGTIDARLLALDAATGRRCTSFGDSGIVDLRRGLRVPPFEFQAYQVTSPPTIVGDLVIVGSAIADNNRATPASGEVRAFDVRSGALRWTFDPIPQAADHPLRDSWRDGSAARTGGANVWSVMVADVERDLVFLPTSSPAPDYYGGARLGDNRYGSSIVALRASTGEVVWHFQTVHHDLWDFDNAAPPLLTTVTRDGRAIPAVLQATKTGMLFVLHRETGVPLFPVEERPVPASDVPGEVAWPTQPFTALTPPLVPLRLTPEEVAWGPTEKDRAWCRAVLTAFRSEGPFTPPSLRGTIVIPSNIGGAHWGGVAVDAARQIAVVPVNRLAAMVQLVPTEGLNADSALRRDADRWFDADYGRMRGTPYSMRRRLFFGPSGLPCSPPPFGSLVAVSLATGSIAWSTPLGDLPPAAVAASGAPNLGGALVTASGLVFVGATIDRAFRAFDTDTGRQLWQAALPAGGRATPTTYEAAGRQFVVIAAGGGQGFGTGDAIVAFALPRGNR